MQFCDFYYSSITAGNTSRLLRAASDVAQVGEPLTDKTPDIEREQCEDGTYTTYTRGKTETATTLQLEGTCEKMQAIADALQTGEICVGGVMYDGISLGAWKGLYCYVDGAATLTVNSPQCNADIATLSLPVIVRDIVDTPAFHVTVNGIPGVYFGNSAQEAEECPNIKLEDCRYIGNGEYVYDTPVNIGPQTGGTETLSVYLCGVMQTGVYTPSPSFGVRKKGDAEYDTSQGWKMSETLESGKSYRVPVGEYEAMIKINTAQSEIYGKPFTLYFHGRGYTL